MTKIRLSGLTLSAFILFSACAKVPESVSDVNISDSENAIEKMSLDEIADSKNEIIGSILSENYDNLIFSDNLDFSVPEEIGKYEIVCVDGYQSKADKLFDRYVPSYILEKCEIIDDLNSYPYGPYIYDEAEDFYCAVGCTGFWNLNRMNSVISAIPYGVTAENYLYIENSAPESADGFDVSPAVLKGYAADYAEDFVNTADYPLEFIPEYVSAYDIDSNKYYYLNLRSSYKGLSIFDISSSSEDIDISFPMGASVVLDSDCNVQSFVIQNTFESYGDGEILEKIISPKSAADALSEILSGMLEYNVLGMKLGYVPTYVSNIEQTENGEKTQREETQAAICSYDVFELTPYWVFIFDLTVNDEVFGLVNCESGDVVFIRN
jgi:hypothetical protein